LSIRAASGCSITAAESPGSVSRSAIRTLLAPPMADDALADGRLVDMMT